MPRKLKMAWHSGSPVLQVGPDTNVSTYVEKTKIGRPFVKKEIRTWAFDRNGKTYNVTIEVTDKEL